MRIICLLLCLVMTAAVGQASAGVPVLLYHHVDYDASIYSVTPERLEKALVITFDDGFADQYTTAFPILIRYGMTAVFFVTVGEAGNSDHMSIDQMTTMAKTGMEFGSHTITHRLLPTLDDGALRDEVFQSRKVLAGMLGRPVTAFAFPGGNLDFRTVQSVRDGGYLLAFSTNVGLCTPNSALYILPRIPVFSYTKGVLREIEAAAATPFTL
ncbi:MAG: polysaccharide deacetylase family protein [Negativicutes bacterium]|nr:polysaccharide deacetylase family protein [Negativicutes bacterium]